MNDVQFQQIMSALRETYKQLLSVKAVVKEANLPNVIKTPTDTEAGSAMKKAFIAGAKTMIQEEKSQEEKDLEALFAKD